MTGSDAGRHLCKQPGAAGRASPRGPPSEFLPPAGAARPALKSHRPGGAFCFLHRPEAAPPGGSEVKGRLYLPLDPTSPLWVQPLVGVGLGLEKTGLGSRGSLLPAGSRDSVAEGSQAVPLQTGHPRLSPRRQDGSKAVAGCRREGGSACGSGWSQPCRQHCSDGVQCQTRMAACTAWEQGVLWRD